MSIFLNRRELLDRFRSGDRAALTEVYEQLVDDVATLARRGFTMESQGHVYVAGAGPEGERELVQETFAKAFADRARRSYDGLRPYRPFLLRITKNLMIDRHRARRLEGRTDPVGSVGDIDILLAGNAELPPAPEPARDLHWQRLAAETVAFVAELDAESQQLIALRFEQELSQEQVADQLGCSRRRVRTLEQRLQAGLRQRLRKRGFLGS